MLQAIIHGKKRRNLVRYWEYEDNITSSFFGPLKYFENAIVCEILQHIFQSYSDCEQTTHQENITFEFWPRIGREPDLLIHIRNGENFKCLHIEVKWFAGESSTMGDTVSGNGHQVLAQRKCVLSKYDLEPKELHSIYLVLNKDKAEREFNDNAPDKVHIVSWSEVARRLRDWNCQLPSTVQYWRIDAVAYLERMISNIFCGFSRGEGKTFQPKDFGFLQHRHDHFRNTGDIFYKVRQK